MMMRRKAANSQIIGRFGWIVVFGLLALCAGGAPAYALCTNEMASARAQEAGRMLKEKMARDPDEAGELTDQIGEIMMAGPVTEQTCVKFDGLLAKLRRK